MGKKPSLKLNGVLNLSKIPAETQVSGHRKIHKITKNNEQNMLTQITKQLYISNFHTASCKDRLVEADIGVILNLSCKRGENLYPDLFQYRDFFIEDRTDRNIIKEFKAIAAIINDHIKEGKTVLLHCRKGISRAPAFAIAYLILFEGHFYEEAFNFVRKKHKKSDPNFGFLIQLEKLSL